MEKSFRRLTIDDYDAMRQVWDKAGLPYKPNGRESRTMLGAEISREHCAAFGVFDGATLVGLTLVNYDGRRGWINRLAVDPDYRRRGLGLQVIRLCEAQFRGVGIEVWAALIEDWNEASLALFRKAGYHVHDHITYVSLRARSDA